MKECPKVKKTKTYLVLAIPPKSSILKKQELLQEYVSNCTNKPLDRVAADDGVGDHALPFLPRAREQRATLCLQPSPLSLSSLSSSLSRSIWCQTLLKLLPKPNPPDLGIFSMTILVVALLRQLFLHFVWQCFQSFESHFSANIFQRLRTCPLAPLSFIKVKISLDISKTCSLHSAEICDKILSNLCSPFHSLHPL